MAVSAANLGSEGFSGFASSWTTSTSFSPAADKLQLLVVALDTSTTINSVTGCSLTWVQIDVQAYDSSQRRLYVFRAMKASPTSGAITVNFSGNTFRCCLCLTEFTGMDTSGSDGSGAIVQSAKGSGNGTTYSATLAAFGDANNATFGGVAKRAASTTPGSGFTELADQNDGGGNVNVQSEFRADNDTTVDGSGASDHWAVIAAEIKDAAATAASLIAPSNPMRTILTM